MSDRKSGIKTLMMSVIMSSPGPLIVGLGLLVGQSSTQAADFIRRSIELLAIILSFVVYIITTKDGGVDKIKKQRYEKGTTLFVGSAMVISGAIMIILALTSSSEEKGNVLPGLAIAVMGVIANSIFWIRYKKLGNQTQNKILLTQSNLYRAKTFVDGSVVIALGTVLLSSNPTVSFYFDLVGTLCVSIYLIVVGVKSLVNELHQPA